MPFFLFFLSCYDFCSKNDNPKTVQALTLILAWNECSSRRAASQLLSVFIASNSPCGQEKPFFTKLCGCCPLWRTPFLILYACAYEVSFPGQITRSLVWERHQCSSEINCARLAQARRKQIWIGPAVIQARSLTVVGRVYGHHIGKALHSAANLKLH